MMGQDTDVEEARSRCFVNCWGDTMTPLEAALSYASAGIPRGAL
jgi:hypothetical protein